MSGICRTSAALETLFHDNNSGDISAGDGRDLIQSAFGYRGTVDPTADNDNVDTAGIGNYFDTGSRWTNTATGTPWFCVSGAPGAAVWVAIAAFVPGPAPIGSTEWLIITTATFAGLPVIGTYHLVDGETVLSEGATNPINNGPWVVHTGPWTRPAWYANGTTFATDVFVIVRQGDVLNPLGSGVYQLFVLTPYDLGDPQTPWTVGVTGVQVERCSTGTVKCTGDGNIVVTPSATELPTNVAAAFTFTLVQVPSSLLIGTIPVGLLPSIPVSLLTGPGTIPLSLIPQIPWTGIGPGTIPDSLLPNDGAAGTYGSATQVPVITVDSKGRVTGASNTSIAIPASAIVSGPLSPSLLPSSGVTPGSYGSASMIPTFTVDSAGNLTAAGQTTPSIPFTDITGSLSTGQLPSSGLTGSTTIVTAVSCTGSSLSVTTHTLTYTNGLITGFTFHARYSDGILVDGVQGSPTTMAELMLRLPRSRRGL